MTRTPANATPQLVQSEWIPFAGGELEGRRPRALCSGCRTEIQKRANGRIEGQTQRSSQTLCFQCYRTELERERALRAAAELDTASVERFQCALPLEPVNHARLARLKIERREARRAQALASPFVDRRRRAQINARHTLHGLAAGLQAYRAKEEQRRLATAARTVELTLPAAWLPFVAAR